MRIRRVIATVTAGLLVAGVLTLATAGTATAARPNGIGFGNNVWHDTWMHALPRVNTGAVVGTAHDGENLADVCVVHADTYNGRDQWDLTIDRNQDHAVSWINEFNLHYGSTVGCSTLPGVEIGYVSGETLMHTLPRVYAGATPGTAHPNDSLLLYCYTWADTWQGYNEWILTTDSSQDSAASWINLAQFGSDTSGLASCD